jgi:hypothetical protein
VVGIPSCTYVVACRYRLSRLDWWAPPSNKSHWPPRGARRLSASTVGAINQARAERTAAQAEIDAAQTSEAALDLAEVYAMIDSLGDIGASLTRADPARMQKINKSLRLEMIYDNEERAVDVVIKPLGGLVRVSEGDLCTGHTARTADLR